MSHTSTLSVCIWLWLAPTASLATSAGFIYTVAGTGTAGYSGDGGPATGAQLNTPYSAVIDNDGNNLYISDLFNGRVRKVALNAGTISTFAGSDYGIFTSGTSANGDGGDATSATVLPADVAIDISSNDIYVVDTTANKVRKIEGDTGKISTVAGTGYPAMTGTSFDAGDGGAATSATLLSPFGICLDSSDNIYIADTFVHKIRRVEKGSGIISTYAGIGVAGTSGDGSLAVLSFLSQPYGVAVYNGATTSARVVYIADTGSSRIRKVFTYTFFGVSTTRIGTVAGSGTAGSSGDGGSATAAMLNGPTGVTADPMGNIYIADTFNNKIRKVAIATGIITTIAGAGAAGSSGDGGAATSALLFYPYRITVCVRGNAYVSDGLNNKVRVIYGASSTSTFVPTRAPTRAPTGPSKEPTPRPSDTPYLFTLPPITIPPVSIPSITIPPVSIPSITIPPVSIPSITIPPTLAPAAPTAAPSESSPPSAQPSTSGERSSLGSNAVAESSSATAIGVSVAMVLLGCLAAAYVLYRSMRRQQVFEQWGRWEDRQKRKLAGLPAEEGFGFELFGQGAGVSAPSATEPPGAQPVKSRSLEKADFTQNPLHRARAAAQDGSAAAVESLGNNISHPSETRVPFSSPTVDLEGGAPYSSNGGRRE